MDKIAPLKKYNSKPFDFKKDSITLLIMIAGAFIQGIAISLFYTPYTLLPSGITGLGLLFNFLFGTNKAVIILLLNVPVIIIGFKYLDLKSLIFSTIGTVMHALAVEYTPALVDGILPLVKMADPLLASAFGSVIIGLSYAPIIKRGATFGGMDIIAMIFYEKLSVPMGTFSTVSNVLVFAALGIAKQKIELGILSLTALFICTKSYDLALQGMKKSDTVLIISDKWDEISKDILTVVNRGITYIPAIGAYTNTPKTIVYCIIKPADLPKLRLIVSKYDPSAMLSVIETKEVIGRRFSGMN